MKRLLQVTIAAVLLGSLTIQADPIKTWNWTPPTQYENNVPIPDGDLVNYVLYCSNTPGEPYETSKAFESQTPPSIEDMAFIVGGLPGTYYCAATVDSVTYRSTSGLSNEVSFTVAPGDLGFVPKPPVLSLQ